MYLMYYVLTAAGRGFREIACRLSRMLRLLRPLWYVSMAFLILIAGCGDFDIGPFSIPVGLEIYNNTSKDLLDVTVRTGDGHIYDFGPIQRQSELKWSPYRAIEIRGKQTLTLALRFKDTGLVFRKVTVDVPEPGITYLSIYDVSYNELAQIGWHYTRGFMKYEGLELDIVNDTATKVDVT
ncbi:MAG: hypothetical protein ACYC0V_14335, partial [Armatimonadota bacterium]